MSENGNGAASEQQYWASGGQTPLGAHTDIADQHPSDYTGNSNGSWPPCWGAYDWSAQPAYRHQGRANFVFTDGHVKSMGVGQVSYANNVSNYPSQIDNIPIY